MTKSWADAPNGHLLVCATALAERLDDRATVQDIFAAAGATPDKRIVNYCGGGISAAIGFFAQKLLGYDDVALYDASMQEWGFDAALPMERD